MPELWRLIDLDTDRDSLFRLPYQWMETPFRPSLDVTRTEGQLMVTAELPGIDPEKDVTIELREHELEIRAERKQEKTTEDKGYRRSEFSYGSFLRVVRMPENAKESDIHATYKDGILEVRVPLERAPEVQPKPIPIERTT